MKIKEYTKNGETYYKFSIYYGTDPLTGKQLRTNRRGFKTRREAIEAYYQCERGYKEAKNYKTFEDVYKDWIVIYKDTVRESTYMACEGIFRLHILPAIGQYRIAHIDLQAMQRVVNTWANEGRPTSKYKAYASKVFLYAVRLGYIDKNPCEYVYIPRGKKRQQTTKAKFWTVEELNLFLRLAEEHLNPMWFAFFRLLAFSGMRLSEALALTWADVDFKENTVSVTKSLSRGVTKAIIVEAPKTKAGSRVIDMDEESMNILRRWKQEQVLVLGKINNLVFSSDSGDYITRSLPIKKLERFCLVHKLNTITLHGFRHTHCSLLFEAGASIKEVQVRLGHEDVETTMGIYAHVSRAQKKDTIIKFTKLMTS